ncbi:hypothetical protein BVX97_02890 [bacterium E08(2017)]|nr:hypothetical protein BVX97_02890 [bacterium E08(2017)]
MDNTTDINDHFENLKLDTFCSNCGSKIDSPDLTLFDELICHHCNQEGTVSCQMGEYFIQGRLGSGAMGTVYKAEDRSLNRTVAIKVLNKALGRDHKAIDAFRKEAVTIAQLNHANIAQIYAFGEEKGQPYIVMEMLSQSSVKSLLNEHGHLDTLFMLQVGLDIAEALSAVSEVGIVHGDIKPENIVFDKKYNAKLVDFGISTLAGADNEGILGTPYYISPERVSGKKIDTRADMYSLGATLYHGLTGHPPFPGQNNPMACAKMRLTHYPAPISVYRKDIDPAVVKTINRMLAIEPGHRHPTYTSLKADFEREIKALNPEKRRSPTITVKRYMQMKDSGKISGDSLTSTSLSGSTSVRLTSSDLKLIRRRSPLPWIVAFCISLCAMGFLIGTYSYRDNKARQTSAQNTLNTKTAAFKEFQELYKDVKNRNAEIKKFGKRIEKKPAPAQDLPEHVRDKAALQTIDDSLSECLTISKDITSKSEQEFQEALQLMKSVRAHNSLEDIIQAKDDISRSVYYLQSLQTRIEDIEREIRSLTSIRSATILMLASNEKSTESVAKSKPISESKPVSKPITLKTFEPITQISTSSTAPVQKYECFITSFDLIDAENHEVIKELSDGAVFDLSELGVRKFSIVAHTEPKEVHKVAFEYNRTHRKNQKNPPYALFGDSDGKYFGRVFRAGRHTITATPYVRGSNGLLLEGEPLTVKFTMKSGNKLHRPTLSPTDQQEKKKRKKNKNKNKNKDTE